MGCLVPWEVGPAELKSDGLALAAPDNTVGMISLEEPIVSCELLGYHFADEGRKALSHLKEHCSCGTLLWGYR